LGTLGQISKNVAIRTETIVNLVPKFEVDRAGFHGEEACASKRWESGKRRNKDKKEKQSIAVTTERLRGFTTQTRDFGHMSISRRRRPVSTLKADILNIIYDRYSQNYSQNNNVKMATL